MKRVLSIAAYLWTMFCLVSTTTGLIFMFLDGDDPTRSDDPYLVGFLVAGILACVSLPALIVREFSEGVKAATITQLAMVFFCCASLFCWSLFFSPPEGQGLITLLAFIVGAGGILLVPFLLTRLHKIVVLLATGAGAIFVAGYCIALSNLASG